MGDWGGIKHCRCVSKREKANWTLHRKGGGEPCRPPLRRYRDYCHS
ncbi:hypothetical protein F7725_005494 [Dissostichus mawsoni]|uniref:Uncharacterized protein n=1 Tax=Dissostichus mawsoni TaxID=36200 RepID=A0A7J5YTW1_DISMA|nr:hypothetical protein F7725_005494 [Dissostichus mawsoni]